VEGWCSDGGGGSLFDADPTLKYSRRCEDNVLFRYLMKEASRPDVSLGEGRYGGK
jgi:hypothetical protein